MNMLFHSMSHADTQRSHPALAREVDDDATGSVAALLHAALDQLDCAIVLMDARLALLHANRQGRHLLSRAPHQGRQPWLEGGLAQRAAQALLQGRRGLAPLAGRPDFQVAVVPLAGPDGSPAGVMLVGGRRAITASAMLGLFAHQHGLTLAETQVLQALAAGSSPSAIAREHGVAECTTRTHIGSLRQKTSTAAIKDLLRQVACLPPVGALVD